MRNRFLRITVGGASCVAVLFLILLLWTRALRLLNERSDLSVAEGVALLLAAGVILLALAGFAVRRLLAAREQTRGAEGSTSPREIEATTARSVCDELFAEQQPRGGEEEKASAPAQLRDER